MIPEAPEFKQGVEPAGVTTSAPQWTPQAFLSEALKLVHPFDEVYEPPPNLREAMRWWTSRSQGKAEAEVRRTLEHWRTRAAQLDGDERLLHAALPDSLSGKATLPSPATPSVTSRLASENSFQECPRTSEDITHHNVREWYLQYNDLSTRVAVATLTGSPGGGPLTRR